MPKQDARLYEALARQLHHVMLVTPFSFPSFVILFAVSHLQEALRRSAFPPGGVSADRSTVATRFLSQKRSEQKNKKSRPIGSHLSKPNMTAGTDPLTQKIQLR